MYSFRKTFFKGLKYTFFVFVGAVIAGLPIVFPQIWKMSVGTAIIIFYDWLKHGAGANLP